MTAGELRRALDGVPDDYEVIIRHDENGVCGAWNAGADVGCDEVPFFAIEATDDETPPAQGSKESDRG